MSLFMGQTVEAKNAFKAFNFYPPRNKCSQKVMFAADDISLHGKEVNGVEVISPQKISEYNFGVIYCCFETTEKNMAAKQTLITNYFIDEKKIICWDEDTFCTFIEPKFLINRDLWLQHYSRYINSHLRDVKGSLAEVGVFRGYFSKRINKFFPNRTLYLFDTFTGFDSNDLQIEAEKKFSNRPAGFFGNTSVEYVLSVLPHPEKAIIKKGFFPEIAKGVNDDFIFVNLDVDLYKPTLAGLEFFYPKMVCGGVILIHDYYNSHE